MSNDCVILTDIYFFNIGRMQRNEALSRVVVRASSCVQSLGGYWWRIYGLWPHIAIQRVTP